MNSREIVSVKQNPPPPAHRHKIELYDNIRFFATLLVVIGHCSTLSMGNKIDYFNTDGLFMQNVVYFLKQVIYSFHMPLFVFLSGALFVVSQSNNKSRNFSIFFKKRVKRLLIPYFFTALFILVPVRILVGYYGSEYSLISIILNDIILGYNCSYLWFLVMLFEVDIIMYAIYRILLHNNKSRRIKAFMLFLFLSVIQYKLKFLPFQLHRTMEFLLWFYIGMLFESNARNKFNKTEKNLYLVVPIFICAYAIFSFLANYDTLMYDLIRIPIRFLVELSGSFIFVLISFLQHIKNKSIYRHISNSSFSIYLYHCPCFYLFVFFISSVIEKNDLNNIGFTILIILKFVFGLTASLFIDKIVKYIMIMINNLWLFLCKHKNM